MSAIRILVLAVAVLFTSTSFVLAGPGSGGGQQTGAIKVEGVITAVNVATGQVSIRTQSGAIAVVVAGPTTKIERNGRRVTLAALKVGDRGQAITDSNGVASKIEARGL